MMNIEVFVYDRRKGDQPEVKLTIDSESPNFAAFKKTLCEVFNIGESDSNFVVVNTNRAVIDTDASLEKVLKESNTLYILTAADQELSAPTYERVEYIPHYDTLVKSGIYEYYASEGQNPLPFAFAELIDNALAATAGNKGLRKIEIQLMFDDALGKPAISVWDNGQGMTSRVLNNWAIYRLSKFNRDEELRKIPDGPRTPLEGDVMRYLNSDISWFGVGGKQAIFFIGNATRMITKTDTCADVHELCISKEEFERKEQRRESIYSGQIYNRRAGDCVHIPEEDENVRELIRAEEKHESFTSVVVSGINSSKVLYLRYHFDYWCQQLAHIYHYYLHGPRGNEKRPGKNSTLFRNIDIQVVLFEKGKQPKRKALRDIDDDLQSQYIRTTASAFEFRSHCDGGAVVEGMLRYHPFLYDRESYPQHSPTNTKSDDVDDMEAMVDSRAPRGNRPIFECYWNGRLIPYTAIDCLEWCSAPKKRTSIPAECYNRFSGALWTNDAFQVSTNKLTFLDLEVKLKEKATLFNRVILGQEQRAQISRAFHDWIKECHEAHDKQVKFSNFKGIVKRTEFAQKHRQTPWSVFQSIEWDGKIFKAGSLIKTQRCVPPVCGTIQRFLLYGDYEGDVFATGGEMEIIQEPKSLYGEKRVFSLAKLDRSTTADGLKKFIAEEEAKLPSKLCLQWPGGDEVIQNAKVPAGSTIGDIKVDILNGKGESISKLPGEKGGKRLLVEMKVILHEKEGDKVITQHVCQHGGKSWPYWFRKFANITCLGSHSLTLQVLASDSMSNLPASSFPKHKIKFTVIEGEPEKFTVGVLDQPLRIASPFQIPLNLQDNFGNPTKPSGKFVAVLTSSGLEITHEGTAVKGNSLIIKGVTIIGNVPSHAGKDFNVKVSLSGIGEQQTLKMRLLPGPPNSIVTDPPEEQIEIENGSPLALSVQVKDKAGNLTVQPKLNIVCKLTGSSGLPTYLGDCSTSGKASLTGASVVINNLVKPTKLKAKIELQHLKDVPSIEKVITVVPSSRAAVIEVYYTSPEDSKIIKLNNEDDLSCVAGETVTGLSFKIFDEGKRQLPIDNALAAKVKVNWMNKVGRDIIKQSLLPDIKAPNTVNDTKFCQVSLGAALGVEFSFTLVPQPDKASSMKCTCSDNKLQLGDALKHDIIASFTDKFGNQIKQVLSSPVLPITVTGEGLREAAVKVAVNKDGNVSIKNIQFDDRTVGVKELTIKCENLTCYQRIQVNSGPPAKLRLINLNVTQPIGVFSNTLFPKPIVLQLCDAFGNPCLENNVKVVLNKDSALKLNPTASPQKTDSKGQATFGQFEVSGQRGTYEIRIKALIGRTSLDADPIPVRIDANPNKPVKLVVDQSKFQDTYVVGSTLKDFSAHVLAEDDHVMKCNAKEFVLKLWPAENSSSSEPPAKAISFQPGKKVASDKENHYYFRDISVPEQTGPHCFLLLYSSGGNVKLKSDLIRFSLQPGPPVKLVPVGTLATPTVSNTQRTTSRYLLKNTKFLLKDQYDNVTGTDLSGKIEIRINKPAQANEVPMLQGNVQRTEIQLVNGAATVQTLSIEQNTAGTDGQEYVLSFTAQLNGRRQSIPAFNLPFLFYNDVRKQQQSAQLTKERDHLFETIKAYKSLFDTTRQLIDEMKVAVHEAGLAETKLRQELTRQSVPAQTLNSNEAVDVFISQLTTKRNTLQNTPRRQCGLNPGPRGEAGILGKVAHLAEVMDNDIARVLSWHLSGDMDCVITLTTEKAKKVYRESKGAQQVLPLDSIYKRSLPEWNKPLPHERSRSNTQPAGHPIYARSSLIFPTEQENCKIVFGMLLGDTIILDNLDCANNYRQEVVKYTHCPTILTRTGDRIRSNGKFGGLQNKAPIIERLRGVVFAAPLPLAYHTICTQLEQFKAYKQAMIKHSQAKDDYKVQFDQMQTPQMQSKHQECREAEVQLRRIEERLGMTPAQYEMPASPATMLQSALGSTSSGRSRAAKSSRASSDPRPTSRASTAGQQRVVNGAPSTPTRSRRSTTAPDSYASPSKRPRRS